MGFYFSWVTTQAPSRCAIYAGLMAADIAIELSWK
jgi:hypothetical protein